MQLLNNVRDIIREFISLSDPGTPDHFSGVLFIAAVERPGSEIIDDTVEVEKAVFAKGTVAHIQNMLANVFEEQPGLFALIQEAVVAHVAKHFKPEEAQKLLHKAE